MKTIIIFGPNGMLGRYLNVYFSSKYNVRCVDRTEVDAETHEKDLLLKIISSYDNPTIINCIGLIPQTTPSEKIRSYIQVNTLWPRLLADCCEKLGFNLIHISTDCVFDGMSGLYIETDPHTETNIYGTSKSLGEPSNCTVIRTSIIGRELKGKKSLLEWVISNKNKEIGGYDQHYWNGVTCLQLAKIIEEMIEKNIFWNGVRHIFSPKSVSKYDLIMIISKVFELELIVNKVFTPTINKTLQTLYPTVFDVDSIEKQIEELYYFKL